MTVTLQKAGQQVCVWLVLGDDHYKRCPLSLCHTKVCSNIMCAEHRFKFAALSLAEKIHIWGGQKKPSSKNPKRLHSKRVMPIYCYYMSTHVSLWNIHVYLFQLKSIKQKRKTEWAFLFFNFWMKCIHGHYEHPKFIFFHYKKAKSLNINIKWCSFDVLFGRGTSLGTSIPAGVLNVYL